jgi:hypothetical protein
MNAFITQDQLDLHIDQGRDLYRIQGFPHKGWNWVICIDLGTPQAICQANPDHPDLRYVHTIRHDEANLEIQVGFQCCDYLTDETKETIKCRERLAKRSKRLIDKFNKQWKLSLNNHWILVLPDDRRVVIMASKFSRGRYGFTIDGQWVKGRLFHSIDEAKCFVVDLAVRIEKRRLFRGGASEHDGIRYG